jgi:hypothetical protein
MSSINEKNQQRRKELTNVVTTDNQSSSFGFSVKSFGHLLSGESSSAGLGNKDSLGKLHSSSL